MNREGLYAAFRFALGRTRIKKLNGLITYSGAHNLFAFHVVRDTLLRVGVNPGHADNMADKYKGSAISRLKKCADELGISTTRKDRVQEKSVTG